jgi:hypothetical protein
MPKRKRRLPGEGEYGTDFEDAFQVDVNEDRVRQPRFLLAGYADELEALAIAYRRNLETGHLAIRQVVSHFQSLPLLRAFWPMTSIDGGGDVVDLSGQGRTLSLNNVFYGTAFGLYMPALTWSVTNGELSRSDETGLNWNGFSDLVNGGITIMAWVHPSWTGSSGRAPIVSKGDGGTAVEYNLRVHRGTYLPRLEIGSDSFEGSNPIDETTWNFVAATYDETDDSYTMRVNGLHEAGTSGSPSPSATTDDFYVGRYDHAANGDEYWRGGITLVALSMGAVSEDILHNVYEATRPLFGL